MKYMSWSLYTYNICIYIFIEPFCLLANSSHSVCVIDVKLRIIMGRHTGSVIRG